MSWLLFFTFLNLFWFIGDLYVLCRYYKEKEKDRL